MGRADEKGNTMGRMTDDAGTMGGKPNPNPTGKRAGRRADRHILYKEGGQAGRAGQTSRAAQHGWQLDESRG